MTIIFGGGLPVLYPIAAAYFLVTYWIDKYLLYRAKRHPSNYNGEFFISSIKIFQVAIYIHIVVNYILFSHS
jgi:hypothetical protein